MNIFNNNLTIPYGLLEELPDPLLVFDQDFRILFTNEAGKKWVKSLGDAAGLNLWEEIPSFLREGLQTKLRSFNNQFPEQQVIECDVVDPLNRENYKVKLYLSGRDIILQICEASSEQVIERKILENHEQLLILQEAAHHIIYQEEPKALLDSLFSELSDYLNLEVYFNYILDQETQHIRLMNYSGIDEETAEELEWLKLGEAVCGKVAESKQKLIIENIQQSSDPAVSIVKKFGIEVYACHPLLFYGRLIGTLSFGTSKRTSFSAKELELLETVSNQVAAAFERTFLISELRNKNQELEQNYNKLLRNEKKYKNIFDGAMDGILLMDQTGLVLDANYSACTILDLTYNELVSQPYQSVIDILRLDTTNGEVWVRQKKGTPQSPGKLLEYSINNDHGFPGVMLFIFRDTTTKRMMINTLSEAKELAEKTSRSKSEFLAMMSHQLRTPLNTMLGYIQILAEDDTNPLNNIQNARVTKMLDSCNRLIRLTNEILDHLNLENGTQTLKLECVNLDNSLEEAIQGIQSVASEKSIQIKVEEKSGSDRQLFVEADAFRVKQILINILNNAVKYSPAEGNVEICHKVVGDFVRITVKDYGIGISEEYHKAIFEPFFRIYDPYFNIEGTGIGLTLVKNFVILMGGKVGVRSQPHQGSQFWFTLRLKKETLKH
ncbi:GAF domain-containing sensor histidine kinase [Paenibacillus physcomitrellae]|uniref:histidine kinase n=1 Tax=Paenibacillus physcomitrellae TaxID=1619311 RepID=A0ABQ1FRC1_9BACL|nr:ATP-binding protein [Paenibacillus physcomitrellae]GGA26163.1 hypothetical protein GCM10010917_08760 [Paenibacillus physcomitrellae]